jgi:release factor glutamine methyltransferase
MPKTYSQLYIDIRRQLRSAGVEAYGLEARLIVAHAAGKSMEKLLQDMTLYTSHQVSELAEEYLARRLAGEPVAYITGSWEFYGLPMIINPDVLIPRSDTEVLVESAVSLLRGRKNDARILDLCTGSGCIGCAMAHELPASRLVMVDKSTKALSVARKNVHLNGFDGRAVCVEADVMEPPPLRLGSFDMIVCNPPYIETDVIPTLDVSVKDYEPLWALDGGADGLDFYRAVLERWKCLLRVASYMVFEVGETQAEDVIKLMRLAGFKGVESVKDTAGIDRVVLGRI